MRANLFVAMMLWAGCGLAVRSATNMDFRADFHALYRANQGEGYIAAGKYAEAVATYTALAAETGEPELAALAKARAAVALGLQDGKYEEGLVHAKGVADRAYSIQAQMQLMFAKKEYQRLFDAFRDEDIAAWPERQLPSLPRVGREDVRALALFDRGRSCLHVGDTQAAVRDIDRASEFAGSHRKLNILSFLARDVYGGTLKDADMAFETNMRIVDLNAGYAATFHAAISAANYLRERERYDEAIDILNRLPWRTWGGFWFVRFANAVGQTLATAGRFAEAGDAYCLIAQADAKRADGNARGAAALQWGRMLVAAGNPDAASIVYKRLLDRADVSEMQRQQAEAALVELAQATPGVRQ